MKYEKKINSNIQIHYQWRWELYLSHSGSNLTMPILFHQVTILISDWLNLIITNLWLVKEQCMQFCHPCLVNQVMMKIS